MKDGGSPVTDALVLYETLEATAVVTMNRPQVRNADPMKPLDPWRLTKTRPHG